MPEVKRGICTDNISYPSRVIAKGLVSVYNYYTPFESSKGVTGKFFRGGKSLFLTFSRRDFRFFPVGASILVDPEKVSVVS